MRKALSKKTRFDVFKRDGFTCTYCGSTPPGVVLHVDHIKPVCDGGTNDEDNLTTSCDACNFGKGGTGLNVVPLTLEAKAVRIREQEEQWGEYCKAISEKDSRLSEQATRIIDVFMTFAGFPGFTMQGFDSIKRFCGKLPLSIVENYAHLSIGKFGERRWTKRRREDCFRYFCGCCWRGITRIENGEPL